MPLHGVPGAALAGMQTQEPMLEARQELFAGQMPATLHASVGGLNDIRQVL